MMKIVLYGVHGGKIELEPDEDVIVITTTDQSDTGESTVCIKCEEIAQLSKFFSKE